MCLLFDIFMLVFGIVTIYLGRFTLTKTLVVRGAPARIIGAMMILPLPLTFAMALPLLVGLLMKGADVGAVRILAVIVQFGILLACFAVGVVVALNNAEPMDRPPDQSDREEGRPRPHHLDVRLTRDEEDGNLPAVCMCCGEPATTFIDRSFLLHEPVVRGPSGFVEIRAIRLLIATANTPRFRLRTSFCEQHRHYWRLRFGLVFGGLAGLFAVLFGGLAVVVFLIAVARINAPWVSAFVMVPLLLYLPAWLIPMKLVMDRSIRARRTEDGSIALQNVGERYATAVEAGRQRSTLPAAAITTRPGQAGEPVVRQRAPRSDRERPAPGDRSSGNLAMWLVLGGVGGVMGLALFGLVIGLALSNRGARVTTNRSATRGGSAGDRDKPLTENERPDPPDKAPFATDPKLLRGAGKVYLSDLQEFAWKRGYPGWDHFGKNGQLGEADSRKVIKVKGAAYAKGLAMHPDDHGYTRVCYALGKQARSLSGSVAISETGGIGLGPVRFVILGDGKVLWRSRVIRELRVIEKFTVDVANVKILELRVYAQEGNNWSSHAAWLDPYVTRK